MAEFCRECFYRMIGNRDDRLVMSEESDLCEGCGEIKPVVLYVYHVKDNEVEAV